MAAATLITPLATGIASAPSGTAEFYLAGTNTPEPVYELDEQTGELSSLGTQVTLDSEGSKVCYAVEKVDCVVRTASGTLKRRFRVIVGAESVEIASQSFTGTLSSGSTGAGGDIDGTTVLNRWRTSAGAADFLVRRTGSSADETLIQAFAAVQSSNTPYFDVTLYGATGDGTTDDSEAMTAAYTAAVAAGGGIVYFPAGTYVQNSALSCTSALVSFLGCGGRLSVIKTNITSGYSFVVNPGSSDPVRNFIRDLGFEGASNAGGLQIVSAPGFVLDNVHLKNTGANTAATPAAIDVQTRVVIKDCQVDNSGIAGATPNLVYFNTGADGSIIRGGRYRGGSSLSAHCVLVTAPDTCITEAAFEVTSFSAASLTRGIINLGTTAGAGNPSGTRITNNKFTRPASANPCISLNVVSSTDIYEAGNSASAYRTDVGFFSRTGATFTGTCTRGSRIGRSVSSTTNPYVPDTDYEVHRLSYAANATINSPAGSIDTYFPGDGGRLVFIIQNSSGAGITITWNAVFNAAATNITAGRRYRVEFVYDPAAGSYRQLAAGNDQA